MSTVQSRAWLALVATSQLLPAALDRQLLADAGLTHFEYMVLGMLFTAEGRTLQMTHLAEATNATLPRLSKVVSRLHGRGLVERRPCPGDGRATNVRLTVSGRRTWANATDGHVAMARDHILGGLDSTQLAALADALSVVLSGLDPDARLGRLPTTTPPPSEGGPPTPGSRS